MQAEDDAFFLILDSLFEDHKSDEQYVVMEHCRTWLANLNYRSFSRGKLSCNNNICDEPKWENSH
jgi:hypothetical protein